MTDDDDLVTRAREGDHAAFGELVDRHSGAAYRMARAALGSPQDAEDAAQDAFVLAYQKLGTFRGDASFKTWLLTIVWRQAIKVRTMSDVAAVGPVSLNNDASPEILPVGKIQLLFSI